MEDFEFDIEFDEGRDRKSTNSFLKHIWKRNFIYMYIAFGLALVGIVLRLVEYGALIVNSKLPSAPLFIAFFGFFLLLLYFQSKKKTGKRLERVYDTMKDKDHSITFFNDATFGTKGGFADCTLAWNCFSTYDTWKGHLIVYHAGKGTTPVMITVPEIGHENFDRLLKAVKAKVAELQQEVV